MALLNSIGGYQFLFLHGQVVWWQQSSELIARPGVDGVGLLRTGRRGEEFVLRSVVDAPDYPTAELEMRNYETIKSSDAVMLIQDDLPMGFVFVLDVKPVVRKKIAAAVGGINSPSLGLLIADWRLIAAGA